MSVSISQYPPINISYISYFARIESLVYHLHVASPSTDQTQYANAATLIQIVEELFPVQSVMRIDHQQNNNVQDSKDKGSEVYLISHHGISGNISRHHHSAMKHN